jgi:peptide/nickel transport system substrate-binding protein
MYAPPYEDTEITAGDFVRALERTQDPKASAGGYGFYYSGFTAEAPDDYTFTVTSETPTGDLDFRMAMPTMAPIPEGAADGHPKDYGRYLVASGPYMYEGAEQIDAANDVKATGYEPGRSLVLVRNPSWDAATDDIRDAYVDRIEVTIGGTEEELANKVDNDEIDMAFDVGATPEQIEAYTTTPELQDRFYNGTDDAVSYSSFNLGIPPFDDVHVRKAINWVINKDALRRIAGGPETGEIAGHIFVDGVIAARNSGYDPYATPNGQGDVEKAKAEMAQSKYDSNGDGVCDDPSCKNIFTVSEESSTNQKAVQRWQQDLQQIGITLDNRPLEIGPMYAKCNDPAEQVAFCPTVGWGKDYPDGYTFGPPLFGADGLFPGCCNYSLLGATPDQLKEWGYTEKYGITSVPSVDDQMNECASMTGDARIDCWAEVDKTLMEDIVPWVPRRFAKTPFATSTRVQNWIFDQFAGLPALDHIALANGGA